MGLWWHILHWLHELHFNCLLGPGVEGALVEVRDGEHGFGDAQH